MFQYFEVIKNLLAEIEKTQTESIDKASQLIAASLMADGIWHVFGTGHSHFIAEELYYRAGGLAPVNPIFFPALMQHEGPVTSTKLERMPGLARILYEKEHITAGDVLMVVSTSGKNPVPVEMAMLAKEHGVKTIALTSLKQSQAAAYNSSVPKKLFEVCDIVIDTCGDVGDAALEIGIAGIRTAPTSSIAAIAIVEQIVFNVCCAFARAGKEPPVFKSANLPGGDEWNRSIIETYRTRSKLY